MVCLFKKQRKTDVLSQQTFLRLAWKENGSSVHTEYLVLFFVTNLQDSVFQQV